MALAAEELTRLAKLSTELQVASWGAAGGIGDDESVSGEGDTLRGLDSLQAPHGRLGFSLNLNLASTAASSGMGSVSGIANGCVGSEAASPSSPLKAGAAIGIAGAAAASAAMANGGQSPGSTSCPQSTTATPRTGLGASSPATSPRTPRAPRQGSKGALALNRQEAVTRLHEGRSCMDMQFAEQAEKRKKDRLEASTVKLSDPWLSPGTKERMADRDGNTWERLHEWAEKAEAHREALVSAQRADQEATMKSPELSLYARNQHSAGALKRSVDVWHDLYDEHTTQLDKKAAMREDREKEVLGLLREPELSPATITIMEGAVGDFEARLQQSLTTKEKQLAEGAKREAEDAAQFAYKPEINRYPGVDQGVISAGLLDDYVQRKKLRLQHLREEMDKKELAECSFHPTVRSARPKKRQAQPSQPLQAVTPRSLAATPRAPGGGGAAAAVAEAPRVAAVSATRSVASEVDDSDDADDAFLAALRRRGGAEGAGAMRASGGAGEAEVEQEDDDEGLPFDRLYSDAKRRHAKKEHLAQHGHGDPTPSTPRNRGLRQRMLFQDLPAAADGDARGASASTAPAAAFWTTSAPSAAAASAVLSSPPPSKALAMSREFSRRIAEIKRHRNIDFDEQTGLAAPLAQPIFWSRRSGGRIDLSQIENLGEISKAARDITEIHLLTGLTFEVVLRGVPEAGPSKPFKAWELKRLDSEVKALVGLLIECGVPARSMRTKVSSAARESWAVIFDLQRVQAFRLLEISDDEEGLRAVLAGVPPSRWNTWRNDAGRSLLDACAELGRIQCEAALRRMAHPKKAIQVLKEQQLHRSRTLSPNRWRFGGTPARGGSAHAPKGWPAAPYAVSEELQPQQQQRRGLALGARTLQRRHSATPRLKTVNSIVDVGDMSMEDLAESLWSASAPRDAQHGMARRQQQPAVLGLDAGAGVGALSAQGGPWRSPRSNFVTLPGESSQGGHRRSLGKEDLFQMISGG